MVWHHRKKFIKWLWRPVGETISTSKRVFTAQFCIVGEVGLKPVCGSLSAPWYNGAQLQLRQLEIGCQKCQKRKNKQRSAGMRPSKDLKTERVSNVKPATRWRMGVWTFRPTQNWTGRGGNGCFPWPLFLPQYKRCRKKCLFLLTATCYLCG